SDQEAWKWACRPNGRLTRGGNAAHLSPATRMDLVRRYGLYLDYAMRTSSLDLGGSSASAVTPDLVSGYVAELKRRVASVTVHGSIAKLRRMTQVLDPAAEFKWLHDMENDLALDMIPASKFDRIVESENIVLAGLTLMEEAMQVKKRTALQQALAYRNGLMITLLALSPIRLKNFSSLTLFGNFIRTGADWSIALSAKETKERRPDERPIPPFLTQYINAYLDIYRPKLGYPGNELWVGLYGKPVSYLGVERIVIETTRQTLGISISPHLFRACGASTAYMHGANNPNLASALLNHRDPKITQDHYNRSRSAFYGREFQRLLDNTQ
ncbi:MAG: site-specific integrase, partial [Aestuariivirga sp.]